MSISTAINLLLNEYPQARQEPFSGHPVADFVRNDFPDTVREVLGEDDRYLVEGSPGKGKWARVPWLAVFDRLITDAAREGFYLVYLPREDFSGIYLSLNQGVETVRDNYGSSAKKALTSRAADYRARLDRPPTTIIEGGIDLAVDQSSNLGAFYEAGAICSKLYERGKVPNDNSLEADLKQFIDLYANLATKDLTPPSPNTEEDDEAGLGQEDLTVLREHKRIDRNQKLAKKAKSIHGYRCQACGFDFYERYGDLGQEYIEAHHLTPIHELKGQKISLDPKVDFAVLCANCHRMIHRSEFVDDIEKFRAKYLAKGDI